jgi:hypothetical protein
MICALTSGMIGSPGWDRPRAGSAIRRDTRDGTSPAHNPEVASFIRAGRSLRVS